MKSVLLVHVVVFVIARVSYTASLPVEDGKLLKPDGVQPDVKVLEVADEVLASTAIDLPAILEADLSRIVPEAVAQQDSRIAEAPVTEEPEDKVSDDEGKPCILATMSISVCVPYETTNGITKTHEVIVPKHALDLGLCEGKSATIDNVQYDGPLLRYAWTDPGAISLNVKDNYVQLHFERDNSVLSLKNVQFSVKPKGPGFENTVHPDTPVTKDFRLANVMAMEDGEGIKCTQQKFTQDDGASVTLTEVHLETNPGSNTYNDKPRQCRVVENNNAGEPGVAIGVGVTVGVLIVVVVAGFVYKRYKNHKKIMKEKKLSRRFNH